MKKFVMLVAAILSVSLSFALNCEKILFGTGNDKFSMGISKNDDDSKTYDFPLNIYLVHDNKFKSRIDFSITSFTDRKKGTRHDELSADYSFSYTPLDTDCITVNITPSAGFFFSGDLGMDFVQNIHHKRVNVKPVNLVYDENLSKMAWGGELEGIIHPLDKLKFSVKAGVSSSDKIYPYASGNVLFNCLGLEAGYYKTLFAKAIFDNDFFRFEFFKDLESTMGYGTLQVDLMSFFKDSTWEKSDYYITIGVQNIKDYQFLSNFVTVPFTDKSSFVLTDRYTSGFPISNKIPDNLMSERNYNQLLLGYKIAPFDLPFVKPYGAFNIGWARWQIDKIYLSEQPRTVIEPLDTFMLETAFGIDVFDDGFITLGKTTLKLNFAAYLHYFASNGEITNYMVKDYYHDADYTFDKLSPSFYFGITLGNGF